MWKWIKIPKALALIAFVLPWMTVSCSGTKILSATGFGMASGHFTSELANAMRKAPNPGDGEPNLWLIAAIAVIAIGLIATLLSARRGALVVLGTSIAGAVLVWAGTMRFSKSYLAAEMAKKGATPPNPDLKGMDEAALAMIRIDWHFGFWLALAGLVIAGVMAWLVFSGCDRSVERSVRGAVGGAIAGASGNGEATLTCPSCGRSFPEDTRFCPEDGTPLG